MGISMTLLETVTGQTVEILSVDDGRFARASLLPGLVDGAAVTIIARERGGSMLLDMEGAPTRVPPTLARHVTCRRLSQPRRYPG